VIFHICSLGSIIGKILVTGSGLETNLRKDLLEIIKLFFLLISGTCGSGEDRDVKSREFLLRENDNQDTQMTSFGFSSIKTIERWGMSKMKSCAFVWEYSLK
jgi:hypothetical protein